MSKVTEEEKIQMNKLYLVYGTYSAVAKEVGRAPSTVKRYIDPNFKLNEEPLEEKTINWDSLLRAPALNLESFKPERYLK